MAVHSFRGTRLACYFGYITQAISINLMPLLYATMQAQYNASLSQLGVLTTVVFLTQIVVDLLAAHFGRYLSYRGGCIAAHVCASAGLVGMCCLPALLPVPYVGVLLSAVLLAVGGGLIEVLISPIIDAIPSSGKAGEMSLLHSFYCWGVVAVVLLSTLYFAFVGTAFWRWLVTLWAVVPAVTTVLFCFVPMPVKPEEQYDGTVPVSGRLLRSGLIWLLLALMLFAGATELAPAQWASFFAEKGLGVHKAAGDLLGPCALAFFQGVSRVWFARLTRRWDPRRLLAAFGLLCIISYAVIVLSPWPLISLLGFCLCGLAVGPMWPGVLTLASQRYPTGGTRMFALLALLGDVGCSVAPALLGGVSDALQCGGVPLTAALRSGIAVCTLFPVLLFLGLLLLGCLKPITEKS